MSRVVGSAVLALALLFWVWSVSSTADSLRDRLAVETQARVNAELKIGVALDEVERLVWLRDQESANRAEYLAQLREKQNEIDMLERDIIDGVVGLSVGAGCPSSSELSGAENSGGASRASAELDAGARRAYLDLVERIAAVEAWAQLCHSTVVSWSRDE